MNTFLVGLTIIQRLSCTYGNALYQNHIEGRSCSNNGICLPKNYDRMKIPSKPLNIKVNISIVKVYEVNDYDATVGMIAWINLFWEDNRVTAIKGTESKDGGFISGHLLDSTWFKKLWIPDIYYYRLKRLDVIDSAGVVTSGNPQTLLLFLWNLYYIVNLRTVGYGL